MKVKKKWIIIFSILAFITISIILVLPVLQGKLYSGDYINMNIKVMYNGKIIDKYSVSCTNPNNEIVNVDKKDSSYSVDGGEYGKYSFRICVEKEDVEGLNDNITINLDYINANNWYISNSDCVINISTQDEAYNCQCEVLTKYNDGTTDKYEDIKGVVDGVVTFTWGI